MTFKEWYKREGFDPAIDDAEVQLMRAAWDAAIETVLALPQNDLSASVLVDDDGQRYVRVVNPDAKWVLVSDIEALGGE